MDSQQVDNYLYDIYNDVVIQMVYMFDYVPVLV